MRPIAPERDSLATIGRRTLSVRPPRTLLKTVAAVIATLPLLLAVPAGADGPQVGSACDKDQVDDTTTSSVDTVIRCVQDARGNRVWTATANAADTVNQLRSAGYTVIIDRVGGGRLDECKVVAIRNPTVTTNQERHTSTDDAGKHVTTIVIRRVILTADCQPPDNATQP